MLLTTDYIEPAELTGYVREALADLEQNRFTLSRYLPSRTIDDLHYRFNRGGEGLAEAATFRAYDAESPIGGRPGLTRVTGELPPISRKVRLGEFDRLRLRQAADDDVVNSIFNDAERMALAVAARIELARGEALATGKVVLNENGIVAEVDFGRASNQTTNAGNLWSVHASATPITDLVTWRDRVVDATGVAPGAIVASTKILRNIQRCDEVINAITGAAAQRTRVTVDELNDLLQSEGLPSFEINDAQVSVGGTARRVIPENVLVMVPAPVTGPDGTDLGATLWGTTAESLESGFGLEGDEPGIVAGNYRTDDPVALWTKAAGIALPVLANPNMSLAATVLAAP